MRQTNTSHVFRALADPTRRAIFEEMVRHGEQTVHALTRHAGVSQPAVSKHLTVLKRAKLVRHRRDGRETHYRAQPEALAPMVDWMKLYGAFWRDRFDKLESLLERNGTMSNPNAEENPTTLVVERDFPHPPAKLWRALTESKLLAQWMMNNDFEPTPGRKFQFRADPAPNWNGIVDCEVLLVDPPQRLSYNWGVGDPQYGMQWVVLWTLTPTAAGTHVRMEQSGFSAGQQGAYQGAKYGWQKFFTGLEKVLGEENSTGS